MPLGFNQYSFETWAIVIRECGVCACEVQLCVAGKLARVQEAWVSKLVDRTHADRHDKFEGHGGSHS